MNRALVAYGNMEIKIRDPQDQRYIALIIRQRFTRNNKNSKTTKYKYEFKRGYTRASFFSALIETGLYGDFCKIVGHEAKTAIAS